MRPKKFRLTKENKIKINEMNTTLTNFLHTQPTLSITDLNTLQYTAAVISAGTIKPQPPTKKHSSPKYKHPITNRMKSWTLPRKKTLRNSGVAYGTVKAHTTQKQHDSMKRKKK